MNAKVKKSSKYTTPDGYAYLTKRTLLSKAKSAGKIEQLEKLQIA
jgi:hypothetical protein